MVNGSNNSIGNNIRSENIKTALNMHNNNVGVFMYELLIQHIMVKKVRSINCIFYNKLIFIIL